MNAPINTNDLILIRHGQSNFNRGYLDYLQNHSLQLTWDECIEIQNFNQVVSYAKEHFDCSLTQAGIQQCRKTRLQLLKEEPDIVLVSPYQRALQTCRQIFGNRNIKIEVHPLLAEVFRFSCDIGHNIEQKQNQFKEFDFTHMKDSSELWFIEHLAPHHHQTWRKYTKQNQNLTFEQKQEVLLQFVKQKAIYESCQQLRQRIWKIKDLFVEYKKKYHKIAIVTHFHIVKTLLAQQFDENGQIINPIYVANAHPYFDKIQNLLKYK